MPWWWLQQGCSTHRAADAGRLRSSLKTKLGGFGLWCPSKGGDCQSNAGLGLRAVRSNRYIEALRQFPWPQLPALLGESGDRIMIFISPLRYSQIC
ncbi:hypothetical protein F4782DRAFT_521157 [Xylaria castorea]|nr:hypothetical protein F4782DRAFT_521157 [Xylaria castorea]